MSTQMQLRGGTTAETLLFTGAQREVTVDTDKNTVVVHDGVTPGGFTVASEAQVADSTYFYVDDTAGGSAANAYILVPQANTNQPNSYMNGIVLGFVTTNANTGASTANFQGLGVKNIKYRGGIDPAPGDVFGRVTVIYDEASDWLELQRKPSVPQSQIRVIGGFVSGNALTVQMEPATIDFRSPTLNSGVVNSRVTTATLALAIPAGATLGTVGGVQSTIVVVAIDNAGTVELAAINLAGGTSLDETALISTVAIGAGSTSATTFYSSVARAGVPYRVVGFIQSTQAVAGTWATTPSKVQGQGGQNIVGSPRLDTAVAIGAAGLTAIDFTNIPNWVKKITVAINGISTTATGNVSLQIGPVAGIETTNYLGSTGSFIASGNSAIAWGNSAPLNTSGAAASVVSGSVKLTLLGSNVWAIDLTLGHEDQARVILGGGRKTLAGTLSRVRLTTVGGTDTFDAGSVNIIYEG